MEFSDFEMLTIVLEKLLGKNFDLPKDWNKGDVRINVCFNNGKLQDVAAYRYGL